jgi:hypothetical protein
VPILSPPPAAPEHDELELLIREARARQRRRQILGAAVLAAAIGAGLAVWASVPGGGGSRHQTKARPPATAPRTDSRTPDAWLAYVPSVLPGNGVQPASDRLAFALSWTPSPGIDRNLASPDGISLRWPSEAVLVSRDGGDSWQRSLSAKPGFWGLDVLSTRRAWAVGVTSLHRTADGGRSWISAGEPRRPLVRVAFTSAEDGYGLTVHGRLVRTRDAGASWQPGSWSGRGSAICAVNANAVLVAGENGAVWRTGGSGAGWQRVAPGYAHVDGYAGWFSDLSCQGTHVVEFSQMLCASACGADPSISRVRLGTEAGRKWQTIMKQVAGAAPTPTHTQPASALGLPLAQAAVAGGGFCLLGDSLAGATRLEISCRAYGRYRRATIPGLPLPPGKSYVTVQGFGFANARTGWLVLDQYIGRTTKTLVWTTNDGGRTWRDSYVSRSYRGRWCTKPESGLCYRALSGNGA